MTAHFPPRLLYVAPRVALPTTSGQALMYRHLIALAGKFAVVQAHTEPAPQPRDTILLRLSPWLQRTRGRRQRQWANGLDALWGWGLRRGEIERAIRASRADIVVVVAEPPVFLPAVRAANRLGVPIVAVAHDWSNVWLDLPWRLRALVDRNFVRACRRCSVVLSVSEELAAAIDAPNVEVLFPIPGDERPTASPAAAPPAFHAVYAGIFHHFHAREMSALCAELARRGRTDLLQLWGLEPDWSWPVIQPVRDGGFYRGIANHQRLAEILGAAGALLVICPFGAEWEKFARYSFPSKLTEYCRFGRPVIVWGPPHAAAVRWGKRTGAVRVIEAPDPTLVVESLLEWERDPHAARQIGEAAAHEAATTFSPQRLQGVFENALARAWEAGTR